MGKTALLLGASGETGGEILKLLVSSETYSKVVIIVRREMELSTEEGWEKVEQGVVDFDNLEEHKHLFSGVDIAFCCLGYRGSLIYAVKLARFSPPDEPCRKIDHDYVVAAAKLLKAGGCPSFVLLTSSGAHAQSSLVYLETKGRVEKDVRDLEFDRVTIFRPMQLVNTRNETAPEQTVWGETLVMWMAKKTDSSSFRWSITNKMLAQAMFSVDNEDSGEKQEEEEDKITKYTHTYTNDAGESKTRSARFLEHADIVKLAQKNQPTV